MPEAPRPLAADRSSPLRRIVVVAGGLLAGAALFAGAAAADPPYGFGRPATPQEIAAADIDVHPDGTGLPPGRGSVADGAALYAGTCAACHGERGEKPLDPTLRLTGGQGTLATPKAVQTIGSYWPYATTLFDYIRRAMPFPAPRSLSDGQVYAVTAYLLFLNGIVPENAVLDAATLPKVQMPNRNGFTSAYGAGK
jgi:S-disulfanyl-L-cysteine oxidoreductase SoxD